MEYIDYVVIPMTNQGPFNIFFSLIFWSGLVMFIPIAVIKIISRS